ncbi:CDP-alcohol phosphatidyltransferase family protein [bacterium]|nr:CDP-alcohol phosphatidyltransferase family protein [bacterium]
MQHPKYIIPNTFTSLNMLIGFGSIYLSMNGDFITAGWLIMLSMIMDKLDGTMARLFKASSMFGIEFDSFSDFVSFGFAPAILVFTYFTKNPLGYTIEPFYLNAGIAFYVLLAAMRLSKYNAADADNHDYFSGLTSTQSGALIASWFVTALEYDLPFLLSPRIITSMLFIHGILMVLPFKYSKLQPRKSAIANIFQTVAIGAVGILILIRELPFILYIVGVGYLLIATLFMWKENHAALGRAADPVEKTDD